MHMLIQFNAHMKFVLWVKVQQRHKNTWKVSCNKKITTTVYNMHQCDNGYLLALYSSMWLKLYLRTYIASHVFLHTSLTNIFHGLSLSNSQLKVCWCPLSSIVEILTTVITLVNSHYDTRNFNWSVSVMQDAHTVAIRIATSVVMRLFLL